MVKAMFAGWLADLLGHNEITEWTGFYGKVCCLSCGNVGRSHGDGVGNAVGLDCHDCRRFIRRSSDEVYAAVDHLAGQQAIMAKTKFENPETKVGFNHLPEGILLDKSLRLIYRPVEHCIRDWMHTDVGDGVANTLFAVFIHAIEPRGHVPIFMTQCTLTSKYGRVHLNWLRKNRLQANSLSSFASTVLTIVPIVHMFLMRCCTGVPALAEHVRCFKLLHVLL